MWTNEQIEQAQRRAALCESVTLTRDAYLELLDTARSSNDTALLAKGAVAMGAERTMEADRLPARVAHWIRVTPAGIPVQVVWSCRGKSDPKRSRWNGLNWMPARASGIYECIPEFWLYEPPLPEPPPEH